MKRLFGILTVLSLAVGFTACEEPAPDTTTHNVELTADKKNIIADGVECVTFAVEVDGKSQSEDVQIIMLNDNSILKGMTFSTTTPGEYRFVAAYKTFTSEPFVVTATAVKETEVRLTADIVTFMAGSGSTATFTVTADGEDVTADSTIVNTATGEELEGNTFTTDTAGDYTFVAYYNEYESNTQTIVVTPYTEEEKTLRIAASTSRIKADGVDSVTFTVTYGEDDVTAESYIYVVQTNEELSDATFSTTAAASYTIRAKYNDITSNSVTVDAYDPELAGRYEVGTIYDDGTVRGVIFAIKGFPVYNEDHEVIRTDQYCYIFSMDEEDLQWSTKYEWCNCMSQRGDYNSDDPFTYWGQNIDDYPAFKWCKEHGEGWFLPSSTELNWMWEAITDGARDFDSPRVAEINTLLTENGGEPFCETYYWSSNETSNDLVEVIAFMDDSVVCLEPKKDNIYTARAAYRFKVE